MRKGATTKYSEDIGDYVIVALRNEKGSYNELRVVPTDKAIVALRNERELQP